MATKEYIVALEISTSKIQGAVGINGYDGTTIIAYAQEPVKGFISKGVVRNIDETGRCISNIINALEEQLDGESIEKAYISINGQSVRSIKTSIVTEFPDYTKITPYIIEKMALENDEAANIPADYQKIQVITQEYKLGGDPCLTPIGMSVNRIEGNYINIIAKNQFMRQLEESLSIAKVEIADSFTAAKITAEELLNDSEKRDGCALVDIGADTTTLTLYSNGILRSLCVLPIGSDNITRDLAAEHISYEDAETLKKHAGYKHGSLSNSIIKKELLDKIISARMAEILQNVNHRIKNSNEKIIYAVFTGGGSQLRNIEELIAENIPGIKMRIATNPLAEFSINHEHKHKEEISPILLASSKTASKTAATKSNI
ncbi:MAG: pilus assembly protein PilM [Bacteroidaceae bacterium]|nr:pilus assembly protein PilM [Bacteroidaceae bacterium]